MDYLAAFGQNNQMIAAAARTHTPTMKAAPMRLTGLPSAAAAASRCSAITSAGTSHTVRISLIVSSHFTRW